MFQQCIVCFDSPPGPTIKLDTSRLSRALPFFHETTMLLKGKALVGQFIPHTARRMGRFFQQFRD